MDRSLITTGEQDITGEHPLESKVLYINRVAKVLAGGRRFRFTALVSVGDKNGRVGLGMGKAPEVVDAIRKGEELARKNMIKIYRKGTTIPYEVKKHFCSSTVLLRPAREGSGITAGGPARILLSLAGISDCTAKFFGSNNRVNCAKVTFEALKELEDITEAVYRRKHFHEWRKKKEVEEKIRVASSVQEVSVDARTEEGNRELSPAKRKSPIMDESLEVVDEGDEYSEEEEE